MHGLFQMVSTPTMWYKRSDYEHPDRPLLPFSALPHHVVASLPNQNVLCLAYKVCGNTVMTSRIM